MPPGSSGLKEFGNIYTRIMNPTTDVFEKRVAALEGGVGALAFASGQAAETMAILNLAEAGDEIVSTTSLYGGTYNLFHYTLPEAGHHGQVRRAADRRSVPRGDHRQDEGGLLGDDRQSRSATLDIEAVADDRPRRRRAADHRQHAADARTWCRPIEHGRRHRRPFRDQVHRRARHVDRRHGRRWRQFDWTASGRFPEFTEPDPSYHGLVYSDVFTAANFGANIAYIIKLARPGAARHRRRDQPVQRLPVPAGAGDAAAAHGAAQPERAGRRAIPDRASEGDLGELPRPADPPGLRDGQQIPPRGLTARSSDSASRADSEAGRRFIDIVSSSSRTWPTSATPSR